MARTPPNDLSRSPWGAGLHPAGRFGKGQQVVTRSPRIPDAKQSFNRTLSHNSGNGSSDGMESISRRTVNGQISLVHIVPPVAILCYQIDLVATVLQSQIFCSVANNVKTFPKGNLGRALSGTFLREGCKICLKDNLRQSRQDSGRMGGWPNIW